MSKFADMLKRPLPSKANTDKPVQESAEDGADINSLKEGCDSSDPTCTENGCGATGCEATGCEDGNDSVEEPEDIGTDDIDDVNDEDDFDPDDLSDEELAELSKELGDDALDATLGDEEDEVSLSADEEMRADDMMNMAATSLLVNDELNAQEKAEFIESNQAAVAVEEGCMTEADVNQMAEDCGLVQENSYNKKMIIRLDAASKKKQLFALAVNVSAAAHGDPDYVKLKKVMKMRKILRAKLARKYQAEATKRCKIYFNRLKKSKSGALSKIAHKIDKKEH